MSQPVYVFLPDIPFTNENKTKQDIVSALNQKYSSGKFQASHIIISRKQNKYNAYVQTTQQHQQKLLELKDININGQNVNLKICFPYHQIYINKLPDNINKQDIQKHFEKFGKIKSIELLPAQSNYQNSREKTNINHCYIRYEDNQSAEDCLFSENRHSIKNKEDIRVVRAYKIGQNDETDKRLFLKITPVVQFNIPKVQKELYIYFTKFGELREKVRIQDLSNISSKACVTFTSGEAGQKALQVQSFSLDKFEQHSFVLRPFASKQSYMAFVGNLLLQVTTEEKLRTILQKYGKVVNCTLNPSKKPGIVNAIVSFSEEQSLKSALAQYNTDKQLSTLFAGKPYMDIHMNASLRNEYKSFQKKDRKPIQSPIMSMGGIGVGFGVLPRMNPPPQGIMGMTPPPVMMGMNQQLGMNQPMGIINPNLGVNPQMNPNFPLNMGMSMNPQMTNNVRMPPQNFRPPL